jgi:hypothetical protein
MLDVNVELPELILVVSDVGYSLTKEELKILVIIDITVPKAHKNSFCGECQLYDLPRMYSFPYNFIVLV